MTASVNERNRFVRKAGDLPVFASRKSGVDGARCAGFPTGSPTAGALPRSTARDELRTCATYCGVSRASESQRYRAGNPMTLDLISSLVRGKDMHSNHELREFFNKRQRNFTRQSVSHANLCEVHGSNLPTQAPDSLAAQAVCMYPASTQGEIRSARDPG